MSIWGNAITLGSSGGGGGPTASDAILTVTVPTGSTVTAVKGGVTLSPTMWVQAANNTLNCALFVIAPAQFDATTPWTVTISDGTNTASDTILIDSNKQYDLTLDYNYWLVRNGKLAEIFTLSTYAALTQEELYTLLEITGKNYGRITTQSPIDITDYSTLRIKFCYDVDGKYGQSYYGNYYPTIGYGTSSPSSDTTPNYEKYTRMNSATGQIFTSTFTVDASTATGPKYISLLISGWSGGTGYVNIYDLYLER